MWLGRLTHVAGSWWLLVEIVGEAVVLYVLPGVAQVIAKNQQLQLGEFVFLSPKS